MNLFALIKNQKDEIKRISLSNKLPKELYKYISPSIEEIKEKEAILFSGEYKPDEDEVLKIEGSDLPWGDINFDNPLTLDVIEEDEIENIRGIIFSNNKDVAIQCFDNRKIIKPAGFNLLYSKNTFSKIEHKGITIEQKVDILYNRETKDLYFYSFHNASKIFDLSNRYREATDQEVTEFIKSDIFSLEEDLDASLLNQRMRKKIYLIQKNDVLSLVKSRFSEVIDYARQLNITLKLNENNDKIVLPKDKTSIKNIINFLNDDLYKSPITENIYETNSKRNIKKT